MISGILVDNPAQICENTGYRARARAPERPIKRTLWRFFLRGSDCIKLLAQYVIPLDPRTKKNHQTIAGKGRRCPVCGKRERQYIRQGKANSEYSARSAQYLTPRPKAPIDVPVHIVYRLYMQTRRRVDDLNLYAALDDILVNEGIIKDDSIKYVRCRDGSSVSYDREHPRAEIYIYEYGEEEDHGNVQFDEDVHG